MLALLNTFGIRKQNRCKKDKLKKKTASIK